jgi:hypothetical protein
MKRKQLNQEAKPGSGHACLGLHASGLADTYKNEQAPVNGITATTTGSATRTLVGGGEGDPVTGIKVWVVEETTGDPISNAEVMTKKKYGTQMTKSVKKTESNGSAVFYNVEPGQEYDYEVTFSSFQTASGSIMTHEGEMTELTVRMRTNG